MSVFVLETIKFQYYLQVEMCWWCGFVLCNRIVEENVYNDECYEPDGEDLKWNTPAPQNIKFICAVYGCK